MLVIFSGLPGVGKSSVSYQLAKRIRALYLRIDSIEKAINNSALKVTQSEDAGYLAAYNVAKDNLNLGHNVVADSVNPIELTRKAWRNVAIESGAKFFEVELICSDKTEHQHRVEARNLKLKDVGPLVSWSDIVKRDYSLWENIDLQLDSSKLSIEDCVECILKEIFCIDPKLQDIFMEQVIR